MWDEVWDGADSLKPESPGISSDSGAFWIFIWWSRGDLNPRPPVLRCRYYMLSRFY